MSHSILPRPTQILFAVCLVCVPAGLPTLAQEDATPPTLPETVVEGDPETDLFLPDAPDGILSPMVSGATVFSPGDVVGYGAAGSVTGTKIAIAPLDFPGSIGVVPRDLIADQAADNLADLLRDVSGLSASIGGSANRTDDLLIRGFRVQGNTDDFRKNGFRDSSRVQRELANVDRIEVLKGPAAVLYGAVGEPSGLVNFVTKQPLDYRHDEVRLTAGSFDYYRFTLDSTGPLITAQPIYYRLNVAALNTDSFRDFVYNDRFFIAPVLRWEIDDQTSLTFEGEFLYDERMTDRGIPLYQGSFDAVPRSRYLGEPTDRSRFNDGQVSLVLDHEFHDGWALHTGWVSNWSEEDRRSTDTRRLASGGGGTSLQRRTILQDALDQNHYYIADLAGTACLLGFEHQILLGAELGLTMRDDYTLQRNATNIDIFNPVYGLPQPTPNDPRSQGFDNQQYGVYLQDMVSLTPRLKLLVGLRHDWIDAQTLDTNGDPALTEARPTALNPRFGAVYQLVPDKMSMYAVYSESFQPLPGSSLAGDPFAPERGQSYETGLKFELLDEQLWITMAAFDIYRDGILVPDPADPDYSVQLGQAESKGCEVDVTGRLTPQWNVMANAAYIDARVTEDTQANLVDNRLPNVPYFSTSFWTRYNLIDTCCRNTGVGLGYTYVGERQGEVDNVYTLPSYSRWDAALYYRWNRLSFSLFAENLDDTFYIVSSRNPERNEPGAPFNMRGTVEWAY